MRIRRAACWHGKVNESKAKKSLFVCAGDHSADNHGGKLIQKLKEQMPDLEIWGLGGTAMEKAGMQLLYHREEMTAIGIVEVIRYLPRLATMQRELLKQVIERKPDALLLLDFGGFNVGFATLVRKKKSNVPIIYFISPQVWGSRPWRMNAIAKAVNKMLVIFPFEEALYKRKNIEAKFVGHPVTMLFKSESERRSKVDFCVQHGLDPRKPIIGIFPGSRKQELAAHAEMVMQAVHWLSRERPELQFVISSASPKMNEQMQRFYEKPEYILLYGKTLKSISCDFNEELMTHSDLLWTKSGTTTLEATLIGKPMLIFYRGPWISYLLVLIFKIVKYVGWPNLLHGEGVVPELIQLDCRAEQLVRYTCDWLDVPGLRQEISAELATLRVHLGEGDFTDNALREILAFLKES